MIKRFAAILWKEWKGMQPFFILIVALFVAGLFWVQFSEFMDEKFIWELIREQHVYSLWVTLILCVTGTLGLLTREKVDGHLLYLDGLPVSRTSIYIAKWLLVFTIVASLDALWTLESVGYDLLSRESDDPSTPWRHVGVFLFLHTFVCGFFLCVLFPLSFLRLWSLLALGGIFYLILILKMKGFPYATLLDPFELMQPPSDIEGDWPIPWKHMAVLGVIGMVSWLIGLFIFTRRDFSQNRGLSSFRQSFWGKLAVVVGVIAMVVVWGSYIYFAEQVESGIDGEQPTAIVEEIRAETVKGGDQILTRKTEKFEFVYRKKIDKRLQPLADRADEIYGQVVDYLQAGEEATSGRITVDMTNPLGSHNAGQAYWKKIRMGFPRKLELSEAEAILGHEVCHVVIDRITEGRLERNFNSARWFHEGLASYLEFEQFRKPAEKDEYDHWLALSSSWNEVNFSELVLNHVLMSKRDSNIVYAAGMEWIYALVDVYGDEAPAKLLRAIGRPEAPPKIVGIELWRDACLAAGYDLERIRGRYRVRLRELRETYQETCDKMPEIKKAKVTRLDGQIVVNPEFPEGWKEAAPEGARLICRLRPDDDAGPHEWRYSKLRKDDTFTTSVLHFQKAKIGVQIGWIYKGWCDQPVFGEWIEENVE